jgi:hypothetical protein
VPHDVDDAAKQDSSVGSDGLWVGMLDLSIVGGKRRRKTV